VKETQGRIPVIKILTHIPNGLVCQIVSDGLRAVLSRQRQSAEVEAEVRQGSNVLNRGEAMQRHRARGRGEATPEKPLLPLDV